MPTPLFPQSDAGNAVFPPRDARIETVRPLDEAELRGLLAEAHASGTPVTFSAALTGLAGGAVPSTSGLRVDLTGLAALPDREGFRRATSFLLIANEDPRRGLVAPGTSLLDLNAALEPLGLWYPPHPGELRATLGGNVATNASGPRTWAFGATREYVESLRIVLADGDVLALRRGAVRAKGRDFRVVTEGGRVIEGSVPGYHLPAVKNAAGLFAADDMDLIDLFIGSEGILGAITEIGLRFLPRRAIRSEIFFFPSAAEALDFADSLRPLRARRGFYPDPAGDGLLALEFFDAGSLALAREAGRAVPEGARAAIETETFANDAGTHEKVWQATGRFGCLGSVPPEEVDAFRYAVPRRVADLLRERGRPKYGTDFAVPLPAFRELFAAYGTAEVEFGIGEAVRFAMWGHLGDCHLHCNFLCESEADEARARALYLRLVRNAVALGGTISAEHGVGKKTLVDENGVLRPYLWYMLGEGYREIAEVKRAFDPKGILNAGNMVSL